MTRTLLLAIGLIWSVSLAILTFIAVSEWWQHERKLRYRLEHTADRGVGSRGSIRLGRTVGNS